MLKKNEIYETVITGMTAEGSGVCRIEGMAVFVPMTAIGDKLTVKIVKVLKSYAFGIIENLLLPSPERTEPDCAVFRQCGGCVFRHIRYEEELRYKENFVRDAFERIGGLSPEFEPMIGAQGRCGYRNKAQYPIAQENGKLVCGFYAKHSHRVIPYMHCPLQPEVFGKILEFLLPRLQKAGITAYDEKSHTGLLRHIYIRQGWHSKEIALCFVVRQSIRQKICDILPAIQAEFRSIVSITENINPRRTNVIMGETMQTLAGKPVIADTMCGNRVELSPLSFYQVNTEQAERLYAVGREYAGLKGDEVVLDLYCGAGTIGLSMADNAAQLIGVEIIPEAVENAKQNAVRNGIRNAEFHCGDAGKITEILRERNVRPDIVILDPPRKGCSSETISAVCAMQPERIVMISCNPSTAARDAASFSEKKFNVERVRTVDLFPGTSHVECVVLLSRKQSYAE